MTASQGSFFSRKVRASSRICSRLSSVRWEAGVLAQQTGWRFADEEEDVLGARDVAGTPDAVVSGEIELAGGEMEVEAPALAHEPGDGIARAEDAEVVAGPVAHDVFGAAAVERMGSGSEAEDGAGAVVEVNLVDLGMEGEALDEAALRVRDADAERGGLDAEGVAAPRKLGGLGGLFGTRISALGVQGSGDVARREAAIVVVEIDVFIDGGDGDAERLRRDGGEVDLGSGIAGADGMRGDGGH
jgi:hypothetical protein